jgi:uncharacterized phage protein (TIGR01671 family)
MREIKFRAWDKVNKKMIESPMAITSSWVLFTSEVENLNCTDAIHPIEQYEIMQYTGLKDSKGQEIFEGDIIKDLEYSGQILGEHEVKYDKEMRLRPFHEPDGYEGRIWMEGRKYKVIGNIYEPRRLLRGDDHEQRD